MKFGEFPLSQSLGAILAHSVRLPSAMLKKGHILTEANITTLAENNISHVMVAILEQGDMAENKAAARLSDHISGDNVTCGQAFTGRANLYAGEAGLVTINAQAVNSLNHIDEAITLATIAQNAIVHKGQMIATVKIIPLGVRQETINNIITEIDAGLIGLHPFVPKKAIMVQTELSGTTDKIRQKAKKIMTHRLNILGASLNDDLRCPHDIQSLTNLLVKKALGDHDLILIMGASAITDRKDVIPEAIIRAGGELIHFGMPVDPGNLMLLAKLRGKWVLGLPGCSRSPKLNGIDLILSRICAGHDVTRDQVMDMGVGGLLSEYPGRPQPRNRGHKEEKKDLDMPRKIGSLILAAGQSKRMGQSNKLLLPFGGDTVLSHVCRQIEAAGLKNIFVVTGHEKAAIEKALTRHDITFFHNDLFEEGMSSSVKLGISSLPDDLDAVIILLGDMPNISADILKRLMAAYHPAEGRLIIIPTHKGKRGNPILWDREFFDEFDKLEGDRGAKILLNEYSDYIEEVEVGSEAIFLDIDTFDAYESVMEKLK